MKIVIMSVLSRSKRLLKLSLVSFLFVTIAVASLEGSGKEDTTLDLILTAYCPCVKCCGDFPGKIRGQTASGKMAKQGRTIAMPREFPFGTKFKWNGNVYICEDRGGVIKKKGKVVKIDIYFDSHKKALEFGVKRLQSVRWRKK